MMSARRHRHSFPSMSLPPAKAVPLIPPFLPAPHAAAACIAVPPRRLRIFPLTGKQKPPRSLPDFADAQSTEQSRRGPRNPHRGCVRLRHVLATFPEIRVPESRPGEEDGGKHGKIGRLFFSWKNLAHSRGRPRRHLCRLPSSEKVEGEAEIGRGEGGCKSMTRGGGAPG